VPKVPDLELTTKQGVKGMDDPKAPGANRPIGCS
jgi:hypothetical protein